MKIKNIILVIFAITIACLVLGAGLLWNKHFRTPVTHNTYTILLKKGGFVPRETYIKNGDTVVFKTDRGFPFWHASDKHPSHSIYPDFDPKMPIQSDETWEFAFNKSGTWSYHDHLNSTLRGIIHVTN